MTVQAIQSYGSWEEEDALTSEPLKCRTCLKLYQNPILLTESWDHNLFYRLLQHTIYTVYKQEKTVHLKCPSFTHKTIVYFKIKEEVKLILLLMHIRIFRQGADGYKCVFCYEYHWRNECHNHHLFKTSWYTGKDAVICYTVTINKSFIVVVPVMHCWQKGAI